MSHNLSVHDESRETSTSAVSVVGYAVNLDVFLSDFACDSDKGEWLIDDRYYFVDDLPDITDYLSKKYNCVVNYHLDGSIRDNECEYIITVESTFYQHLGVTTPIKFEYVKMVEEDLTTIGAALENAGFDVGPMGIHTILEVDEYMD